MLATVQVHALEGEGDPEEHEAPAKQTPAEDDDRSELVPQGACRDPANNGEDPEHGVGLRKIHWTAVVLVKPGHLGLALKVSHMP